jgi:hypothetical protein
MEYFLKAACQSCKRQHVCTHKQKLHDQWFAVPVQIGNRVPKRVIDGMRKNGAE